MVQSWAQRYRDESTLEKVENSRKADHYSWIRFHCGRVLMMVLATILLTYQLVGPSSHSSTSFFRQREVSGRCTQLPALFPKNSTTAFHNITDYLGGSYRNQSIAYLSTAVKYETVSYDDLGTVPQNETDTEGDIRWNTRFDFIEFLKQSFPSLHENLRLEKINTFGLLYTWQGSNPNLKPTLLMAHTDVVPVPSSTVGQWTYPPFSGHYDGEFIWGRGASDCKNQLLAILEAITILIDQNFHPSRTILLSFGFDEEIGGRQGAANLGSFVHERYGDEGIEVIVDEGNGFSGQWGSIFASPGVSEKGHIDVEVTIRMPGGHSSIPSDHTAIGVAAKLITQIEKPENKYSPTLDEHNPYLGHLSCGAAHSPDFPRPWKKLLAKGAKGYSKLAHAVSQTSLAIKYLMTTSVAVDIIHGGVKVNALPEEVKFVVNHRVNIGSSPAEIKKHVSLLAAKVAKRHKLQLVRFDDEDLGHGNSITLRASNVLEPAPLTPYKSMAFAVLSGTVRALYGEEVVVSPGLMTGNTDTRHYWASSRNIFRFNPARGRNAKGKVDDGMGKIHTVDERQSVQGHLDAVAWFWGFLQNMDDAE